MRTILIVLVGLTGCTWLVPDREQEYLKVRPLPPLKLPAELPAAPSAAIQPPIASPVQPPPSAPQASTLDAPYIELNQPIAQAWVSTLKALNLLRLELTRRNLQQGSLDIVYTSKETELSEDRGTLEDLLYFFTGAGKLHEEKYRLQLEPVGNTTRIYLLDTEGKPGTSKTALDLLERLKQTLATLTPS